MKSIEKGIRTLISAVILALALTAALTVCMTRIAAAQSCGVQLQLAPDYSFAVGSSSGGSAYSLSVDGKAIAQGSLSQSALFHYERSTSSTFGTGALSSSGVAFDTGKFGKGLYLQSGGQLNYPAQNLLNLSEGTIEMWVAPRYNGSDSVFDNTGYPVFFYAAGNGDYLSVGEAFPGRVMAAFASANGQSKGAYNATTGNISSWKAGDWHHIAATFSASANYIRFYLDGVKIADSNNYVSPSASGGSFQIGSTAFVVDELRISKVGLTDAAVAYDAAHAAPFPENEVIVSLTGVAPGQLSYSVAGCGTAAYNFTGIPITNLAPSGGLLSPGSTSLQVAFNTIQPTTCRYSVGSPKDYTSMQTLDTGPSTTVHKATVIGVSSDPRVVNRVYFRCASNPDYLLTATYRTVGPPPGQSFPRIGNIWIGPYVLDNAPEAAQKTQLFVGANSTEPNSSGRLAQLRNVNPGVLIIPSMIPEPQPDDYFLKDVRGKRIANWCVPEIYLPNQTKPEVAEFFAQSAYRLLLKSDFLVDGVFFDQFNTTIQQPFSDCYGNVVQIDSNGDGIADDPVALNAAWKAGMYAMVNAFRKLAPNAYVMGHIVEAPPDREALAAFNGIALQFFPQTVREGQMPFARLWDLYKSWESQSVSPAMNMIQACPPNQLTYGYGYDPTKTMLPSTIAFAQSFYPNMRFGLGLTLMGNGFFGFDFGDSAPPVTWWYDEYDFNLGYPIGPATPIGADSPVYRRDFTNGVVLLNGTASPQTVTLESGLKRFTGTQAPLDQYMIDDADSGFSASGSWRTVIYDTGTQYGSGTGRFYHCWRASCHQSDAGAGQAQWKLNIPTDGQYAIQVWLPAAPGAATWTKNAIYEVVAGGKVLASATIDQTTAAAGDALHLVATMSLRPADEPFLRVRSVGSGALIADAVYVTSAARYNDGSPVQQVKLGAFDSIFLQRQQPLGTRTFVLADRGAMNLSSIGNGTTPATGYGRIKTDSGSTAPAGIVIFGSRNNGVLVSETAVPATTPLSAGRVYVEVVDRINTGFALVNPNDTTVTFTFFYTDSAGVDLPPSSIQVAPNSQRVQFLNEAPFKTFTGASFQGTLSFTSTLPVGIVALRTYTNELGDFLMSTLPIIDLEKPVPMGTGVLPYYADGGGWRTQILLVNPTDSAMTGTVQFDHNVSVGNQTGRSFDYSIPRRSSQKLATPGSASTVSVGAARIVPVSGAGTPTPLVVFSYQPGGIVTSEAAVPTVTGTAFRIYVESSGRLGQPGSIVTGIAIAGGGPENASVTFELSGLDGSRAGLPLPVTKTLSDFGNAQFLNEVFPSLPSPFKGVLRISTTNASAISVVGLRARYNERQAPENFLITTTAPAIETDRPPSTELLFPLLVTDGGYTTEFILFSGTTGQSSGTIYFFRPDGTVLTLTLN